jgi:hypothetical protein
MHRPEGDQYRILFEHSSDAHFIFDESGITDCNNAMIRLLRAEERSIGMHHAGGYSSLIEAGSLFNWQRLQAVTYE